MTRRPDPRRHLLGIGGPEGRTPAVVAFLVAPMARTWADMAKSQMPQAAYSELDDWVCSLEVLAEYHRRSMSAGGVLNGHFRQLNESGGHSPERRVTSQEAAHRLDVSVRHVLRLLESGQLTGSKPGREWRIDTDSIDAFKERAA